MAELENEKLEEDYLDNLLNSVSDPLPEEEDDIAEKDKTIAEDVFDFDQIEEENILNIDDIETDENILDIDDIETDENILDIDDIETDENILDIDDIGTEENILNIDDIETDELSLMENTDFDSDTDIDVSTDSESIETDVFGNEQEDIEQLLSMLDTDGIDEDLKNEDINKLADELENIPDITPSEEKKDKKDKKEKKKKRKEEKKKSGGLFGKKKNKTDSNEKDNLDISPDDNEQIIKSVEGSFYEGFDLSELEELADLEDIEDRSNEVSEKEDEELKAQKEQKKKEKAEKKAEKKKLKKEKQAEKKAKKLEKRKEKEKKKKDKPRVPEEKIKISISTLILLVSVIAAVLIVTIFGGKYFWYKSHINEATNLLIDKKYTEAYANIAGLTIKEKDMGLYKQIKTLMYIEKEYDSYFNCIKIKMNNEALDSLLQGVEKYHLYKDDAAEYGVSKQADEIYANILKELAATFELTEEAAKELVDITDSQEYSKKVADIVKSHINSIEAVKK